MSLTQSIQNLGLSRNEAKVYLHCLKIGVGSVNRIASGAQMPRTTVYQILVKLQERGLVTSFMQKTVLCYEALNPRHLLENFKANLEDFESFLPELDAMVFTVKNRPRVRFFSGMSGIKMVLRELLQEGKKSGLMQTIAPLDIFRELPLYFPRFVRQRIKNNIRQQSIILEGKGAVDFIRQNKENNELREVKVLSKEFSLKTDETVCGDKIFAFPVKGELFALIIESKAMAKTKKAVFEFIWRNLGEK